MNDLENALRNATPSWMQDGYGVRGPAPALPLSRSSLSVDADVMRRSDAEAGGVRRPAETAESNDGKTEELPGTTTITGSYNGIPSTLEVYTNGGWKTLPPPPP